VADKEYFYHCFVSPCFAPECPVLRWFIGFLWHRIFLVYNYTFCKILQNGAIQGNV